MGIILSERSLLPGDNPIAVIVVTVIVTLLLYLRQFDVHHVMYFVRLGHYFSCPKTTVW